MSHDGRREVKHPGVDLGSPREFRPEQGAQIADAGGSARPIRDDVSENVEFVAAELVVRNRPCRARIGKLSQDSPPVVLLLAGASPAHPTKRPPTKDGRRLISSQADDKLGLWGVEWAVGLPSH